MKLFLILVYNILMYWSVVVDVEEIRGDRWRRLEVGKSIVCLVWLCIEYVDIYDWLFRMKLWLFLVVKLCVYVIMWFFWCKES